MGNFNKRGNKFGNFSGGGRGNDRGGGGGFAGRDSERSQMHQATCSECGKSCEVPFRPTGDKPVYCSDCFRNKRGGDFNRPERRDFNRPAMQTGPSGAVQANQPSQQLQAIHQKLDKILQILSQTTPVEALKNDPAPKEKAKAVSVKKPKLKPKPKKKK